jgi:hypothetical protein
MLFRALVPEDDERFQTKFFSHGLQPAPVTFCHHRTIVFSQKTKAGPHAVKNHVPKEDRQYPGGTTGGIGEIFVTHQLFHC